MERLKLRCDNSYKEDLQEYIEKVFDRFGIFSPTGEREIIYMAEHGNTVANKLYADMVFYKKILRNDPYRDAFYLYLKAAGIRPEDGWSCSGRAYPLSFWSVGYYLVNYRRDSFLELCGEIKEIEALTLPERLAMAFDLAAASMLHVRSAEAVNLAGRILTEMSEHGDIFEALRPSAMKIAEELQKEENIPELRCGTPEECAESAARFFKSAAADGYVYACNNLAAAEAARIIRLSEEGGASEQAFSDAVERYIYYLKLAADKYEPYAANRLGLFYKTGEISCRSGRIFRKEYADAVLAKEYFYKATVYPDSNSAWAFFNLQKYYPNDYINDIELMDEQMEYIKKLNPNVYNLVMDL